jgi:hypothetical protein
MLTIVLSIFKRESADEKLRRRKESRKKWLIENGFSGELSDKILRDWER